MNFWILYAAGVFDDLGVPNLKTLARWLWRRWRKKQNTAQLTSVPASAKTD
ncbi:MAG: hypothetical protein ACLQVY_21130 [Limisphaerales bacterium]